MIPPNKYSGWNDEASQDNTFMNKFDYDLKTINKEFYSAVNALKNIGINVILADKNDELFTPDCIFPNNWISTHINGNAIIYPMKYESRRNEIRFDIINYLMNKNIISNVIDLRYNINNEYYLEGTGALVLDRINKIAFCAVSQRANPILMTKWCIINGYKPILFDTKTPNNEVVYHTNVLMSVGSTYVVICLDIIKGIKMREYIKNIIINECKKDLITITYEQVKQFCGNIIELKNNKNNKILVMSSKAFNSFNDKQKTCFINKHKLTLLHTNINTIETLFGGGFRCMIAELFTENKSKL